MWRAVIADVAPGWQLDAKDLHALEAACRAVHRAHELEAAVRREGVLVNGRPHPGVAECRRQRTSAQALLKQVEMAPPAMRTGHMNRTQRAALRSAGEAYGGTAG